MILPDQVIIEFALHNPRNLFLTGRIDLNRGHQIAYRWPEERILECGPDLGQIIQIEGGLRHMKFLVVFCQTSPQYRGFQDGVVI